MDIIDKKAYKIPYVKDLDQFKKDIIGKTIIPYQVEIQPGPMKGPLCWLKCPYCYGRTAEDRGERLPIMRYVEIIEEIIAGDVLNFVFAGYATDPLNFEYIEELVEPIIHFNKCFGFHTKGLRISERLLSQITKSMNRPGSYFSLNVDAGSNEVYNKVHGMPSGLKLYEKVLGNFRLLCERKAFEKTCLDTSVTYLINGYNNKEKEILQFIENFREAGANLLRFTFPQFPRLYLRADKNILSRAEVLTVKKKLGPIIEKENSKECPILLLDVDAEYEDECVPFQSLPCYARWIFPSIGFDGFLAPCSESAAPNFRSIAMGDLEYFDFWDLFYDYNAKNIEDRIMNETKKMADLQCHCDRKEHRMNQIINDRNLFNL